MRTQVQAKPATTPSFTPARSNLLQRKCSCGGIPGPDGECAECREKRLQRRSAGQYEPSTVPPVVHDVLRSPGQPLDAATRAFMEPRFGHDFSRTGLYTAMPLMTQTKLTVNTPGDQYEQEAEQVAERVLRGPGCASARPVNEADRGYDFSQVRVHADAHAARSAQAVNALAYTVGQDVVFGPGQYAPGTALGRRLLAHELTHVVQQRKQHSNRSVLMQLQPVPGPASSPTGELSAEMLRQIARQLREAMEGLGTDEEAIYSALAGRTQEQVDAIARIYQEMFARVLVDDLRDELSESEMEHLAIFSPTAAPGAAGSPAERTVGLAEVVASQLDKAMKGPGTDEESIFAVLTGRTQAELQAIKEAYNRLTNHELEADLRDELSGSELQHALALLNKGLLAPEDEIYLAVTGLGTDEETLFRVLIEISGDRNKIKDTIEQYFAKGYGDMLDDIRDDLSGADFDRAMELLHGLTPTTACSIDQREEGLEAISEATSLARNAVAHLAADITSGKLSDRVSDALEDNFNRGKAANVVNVALARRVEPILNSAGTELLTKSQVTCHTPVPAPCPGADPCVLKPDCTRFAAAWTCPSAGSLVRLCEAFFECSDDRPTTMLHEFVHHTGVLDQHYHWQPGFSTLTPSGTGSSTDSLNNADSYAHFAKDLS